MINDQLHKTLVSPEPVVFEIGSGGWSVDKNTGSMDKRDLDGSDYKSAAAYATSVSDYLLAYFGAKWHGTWKTEPMYKGWIMDWSKEFVEEPPETQRNVRIFARYPHFEKDLDDLEDKNYFAANMLRSL